MDSPEGKHVFVSYVHEDSDAVDSLCAILEAAQIPYWRDRSALGPGDAWRAKIRQAIREGSLVFLACFSDNSRAKNKSYMNEELTVAIGELRQMPPGRTWLIPVRFDSGAVPEWDLGAGRMLSDLNYSDLFGSAYTVNAMKLVTTILRLMGEKRPDAATALAAIEQAASADRPDLLKRLTKEMLLDPVRRIELDDLITQEVQRVQTVLNDAGRVAGPFTDTNDERIVRVVREAQDLWNLTKPFCASLQVAARWGTPDVLAPWANGLRSFVSAANRIEGGVQPLLDLRHLPGMVGIMTAGLACVSSRKWENLKVLVVDPTVRDRYEHKPLPMLLGTSPYKPFGTSGLVDNTLARATVQEVEPTEALDAITNRKIGRYHTPAAEWMCSVLRPIFMDQWPEQDAYEVEFDRAEVMLGVLAQDAANVRTAARPSGSGWPGSEWYGRSTWHSGRGDSSALSDLDHELSSQGRLWAPLQANLFGAQEERAREALTGYAGYYDQLARRL